MKTELTVLIVDDNRPDAAILARHMEELERWVCETKVCETGDEASAIFDTWNPDIVFMDYYLAGETGIDVIRSLKGRNGQSYFIMLTGRGETETAVEALREGVMDYISKSDLNPEILDQILGRILERKWAREAREKAMEKLEEEVKERTAELMKANSKLEEENQERLRMEKQLIRAREVAEEANRTKDKFLSLVAHDLRNPYTAILGAMELLLRDQEHPLSEEQRHLVSMVIESGRRQVDLIKNVLNIERLHSGNIKPHPLFLDAYYIIENAVRLHHTYAESKGIVIKNNVPTGTRIYADPDLYREVLSNLLVNAVKFSSSGNEILIFQVEGTKTDIAIQDNGVGIEPDRLQSIFLMEERTSTRGTAGEEGTGLGLPLSHDIIVAHEGSLKVESRVGYGSTFTIQLPYREPRVLVVDDETDVRYIFTSYLKPLHVDISVAQNGAEALGMVDRETYHLVITDIHMPVMDGFEMIRLMKSSGNTKHIPVVVITADTDQKIRDEAFRCGAGDFVMKPIVIDDFLPRIRRFLGC